MQPQHCLDQPIENRMARILFVGQGGYGDLFPLFGIATALRKAGHSVSLAAERHHADACRMLGMELQVIEPLPQMRSSPRTAKAWREHLNATLSPDGLGTAVKRLLPWAQAADLIVGNQLAYSGAIVRDMLDKPWVFCAASPLSIPSRYDPPLWPYLHRLQSFTGKLGFPDAAYIALMRQATRALMAPQRRLRRRLGVDHGAHPRFEALYSRQLNLLTVSPLLIEPQSDWPSHTQLTGFCWFEPSFLGDPRAIDDLEKFARDGTPPIVVAPGGARRSDPRDFLERGLAACRRIGRRAILVAAPRFHISLPQGPDFKVSGYLPYGRLFRFAEAVIHSGGIGTLGWALRQGLPSLVLPEDWDQYDNARRAERRDYATVIPSRASAATIARELDRAIRDGPHKARLRDAAMHIQHEDGAASAVNAIDAMIAATHSPRAR